MGTTKNQTHHESTYSSYCLCGRFPSPIHRRSLRPWRSLDLRSRSHRLPNCRCSRPRCHRQRRSRSRRSCRSFEPLQPIPTSTLKNTRLETPTEECLDLTATLMPTASSKPPTIPSPLPLPRPLLWNNPPSTLLDPLPLTIPPRSRPPRPNSKPLLMRLLPGLSDPLPLPLCLWLPLPLLSWLPLLWAMQLPTLLVLILMPLLSVSLPTLPPPLLLPPPFLMLLPLPSLPQPPLPVTPN